MRSAFLGTAAAAALLIGAGQALASPLTLTGNYLQVGISDYGSFGSDGRTEPGLLHDPTGTGNFYPGGVANDYLTPGTPHDSFAIHSNQTGFIQNDNDGYGGFGTGSPTLLTGAAALGYSNAASWTGSVSGITVTNKYFFNAGDERILVKSVITNNSGTDLTDLAFGRSEDPDPDVNRYGSYDTTNTRGDSTTSANDLVSGAGEQTGLTIGILNATAAYTSATEITDYNSSESCCTQADPWNVLAGTDNSDGPGPIYPLTNSGDYGLQMAWEIGTLANGASAEVDYYYVFGTHQGSVSNPTGVPEPATLALLASGLVGLGTIRRRRRV